VSDTWRLDGACLLEFEGADVLEQPLPATHHYRDDVELELIDQAGGEVLLDMFRPITVAPTFDWTSSTTGVLALTSPPSCPCCLRHASSL
jgi:hypothetical protein